MPCGPGLCGHTHLAFTQVHFPGVGQLIRNKAGRIEFVFDAVLVEALELGLGPVRGQVDTCL